ncbi:hypothetical protein [Citrobacter koseri]|uniref:hypothetical protein n=1 Tax=Citrobacter koseri TaxID=545 RepID=UPI001F2FF2F7|nr:hypothetical protein [Citrobacter koseri]
MKSYAEITDLIRQLNGRAQYLRDKGQVKTPDLLERAAGVIKDAKSNPRMFIDGDISPSDADKLAAVIREFNEETETPAARMARIIRENPHPTNMCDMPSDDISHGGKS